MGSPRVSVAAARTVSAVVLVAAAGLAGCSSSKSSAPSSGTASTGSPTGSATGSATGSTSGSATTPSAAAEIVIANFTFSPAQLTVHPNEKITVTNHDSTTHTLTASPGTAFTTGDIAPGASATITAPATAGTYPYICLIHQFMHGTLIVQ